MRNMFRCERVGGGVQHDYQSEGVKVYSLPYKLLHYIFCLYLILLPTHFYTTFFTILSYITTLFITNFYITFLPYFVYIFIISITIFFQIHFYTTFLLILPFMLYTILSFLSSLDLKLVPYI